MSYKFLLRNSVNVVYLENKDWIHKDQPLDDKIIHFR